MRGGSVAGDKAHQQQGGEREKERERETERQRDRERNRERKYAQKQKWQKKFVIGISTTVSNAIIKLELGSELLR